MAPPLQAAGTETAQEEQEVVVVLMVVVTKLQTAQSLMLS